MKNKNNLPCFLVMAAIVLGMVLESIGAALSKTTAIGFHFDLPPLLYVGVALIVLGFLAHFPLKLTAKKRGIDSVVLDAEAILMIVALFFAAILLVCSITFPVLFPANG